MPSLSPMPMRRFLEIAWKILLGLAWTILAPPALAMDDLELCQNSARNPNASIPACTRLIERGGDEKTISGFLNDRGVAKAIKDDVDGALRDFAAALDKNPDNFDAIRNSGIMNKLKGGAFADEAIRDFSRALQPAPEKKLDAENAADLYNWRGSTHLDKDDFEAALKDFDDAIKRNIKFVKAFINRGLTHFYRRNLDKALADFDAAVRLAPKDPLGFSNRAMVRMDKADFKGAIADYDKAIELDPQNVSFYTRRGEAWRLQGDLEKALADHDHSISLKPHEESYNNRALVYKDQGKLEEAKADCSEAITLNPSYALAYVNRGLIRRLQGDLGGALIDLNKAVSLSPRSAPALVYRGEAYREMGDLARAFEDFNEAVRLVPDYVATYVGRGMAYERKGDISRAKMDYEKALTLPSDKEAAVAKPAQKQAKERLAFLIEDEARRKLARGLKPSSSVLPMDPGVRLALVVGNSNYQNVPALPNPTRDAAAVAEALKKLSFKTVVIASNVSRESFLAALQDFEQKAKRADWALIYYAGHGMVVDGDNYLVPVDSKLQSDTDIQVEAIPLETVLMATKGAKRMRLVVLDACRDNPFLKSMKRTPGAHTLGQGLGSIEPEGGTLVAYATRDGRTAEDGSGDHSPFTKALLDNIYKPGLEVNMLFRKVHDDVLATTEGRQEPITYGALPFQNFYFTLR